MNESLSPASGSKLGTPASSPRQPIRKETRFESGAVSIGRFFEGYKIACGKRVK